MILKRYAIVISFCLCSIASNAFGQASLQRGVRISNANGNIITILTGVNPSSYTLRLPESTNPSITTASLVYGIGSGALNWTDTAGAVAGNILTLQTVGSTIVPSWVNPITLLSGQFWSLTGNIITSAYNGATGNFLGTTNTQPLVLATTNTSTAQPIEFFTANTEKMRLSPGGELGIGLTPTALRLLHVSGTAGTANIRFNSLSGADLLTPLATDDGLVISDINGDLTKRSASILTGSFVQYDIAGVQNFSTVRSDNLFNVAYAGGGNDVNAAGATITSVGGATNRSASGLTVTATASGTGTSRALIATANGGANNYAGIFSGRVGIGQNAPTQSLEILNGNVLLSNGGAATQLQFQGTSSGLTTFQAGAQGATSLAYTLPIAAPTSNQVLISNGGVTSNLSWVDASTLVNGLYWTLTGNAITTAYNGTTGNFLGTTNNQPLVIATTSTATPQPIEFFTNNAEKMRLTSGGELGIGLTPLSGRLLHVAGTSGTANIRLNSLSAANLNTLLGSNEGLVIADANGDLTKRSASILNGTFVLYDVTSTQNSSAIRTDNLFNVSYGAAANDANAAGAVIISAGGATNRSATGLTISSTATGTGTSTGLVVSSIGGNTQTAIAATGNVNLLSTGGNPSTLSLQNPAATFSSSFVAGAQAANIGYTLPTVAPAANSMLYSNGGATSLLNWTNTGTNGQILTVTGGVPSWQSSTGWLLTGNSGTVAGTNFLGTLDSVALEFRVYNNDATTNRGSKRVLRIEPNATSPNILAGYQGNGFGSAVGIVGATVAGGGVNGSANSARDNYAFVGGGRFNRAGNTDADPTNAQQAAVVGGIANAATGAESFIGGGNGNNATASQSAVTGGANNQSTGANAFVGGGGTNTASGQYGTVSGGSSNTASQIGSTVSGGTNNTAGGNYTALIGGRGLTLNADGSFGFLGNNAAGSNNATVTTTNTGYFGNVDLWLWSNDNSTKQLRFYEPQATSGAFPAAGTNFTAFQVGSQAVDLTYTLPTTAPVANSLLFSAGGATSNLSWTNTGSNGQVLTITAGIPSWQNFTSGWQLTGNAGTTAYNGTTGNFLGTTDAQPLVIATTNATAQDIRFFTGNTEKLRLSSTGEFGIGLTATANRLLHVTGTSGTPNIRFNSLSGANLATALAANDGLVIADANGDLTKRAPSVLNGNFVLYDVTSTQNPAVVRTDNLFNVSYNGAANDANAAGAVITSAAGATNRSASGLTVTSTATGTGASTAITATATGGSTQAALAATGNINLLSSAGGASNLNLQNPAGTFYTSILAGAQTGALSYTLPVAAPVANSLLFSSGGAASNLSWTNTGSNGQVLTITAGIPSWQNFTSGWQLTGNAGTTAYNGTTGNFLGTTDAQPLVIATTNATAQDIRFFTGNTEKLRLSSTGEFGIGLTATANRLLHVAGTSGTPNIRFNSLSGANLATALAATDGLVIADANGDLTKRSTSILNGQYVQYDVTSAQGTSLVRTNNLYNVSYSGSANDANAAGAVISSTGGATNRNATGLSVTATATGSGTATGLNVTASGGTTRTAINATGNVNIFAIGGTASSLSLQNPAGTFNTNFLAGAQSAALTYTLPTTAPVANSLLYSSGGASSNLGWTNTGSNGQVLTITGGIPSWQNATSSGWQLTGNAGTTAYNGTTGNFLGTTDAQPLVIATTNALAQDIRFFTGTTEKLRLNSSGEFGVGLTAAAGRTLHVIGTSGTPNIRFNSLSGANLATALAATDGLVIADGNGDLTKRSTSILNGQYVQYDVTSTQGTSLVRTNNLYNVSYSGSANDANAAGAVISSTGGATNRSATGLSVTATATGSGTATGLNVTASGGTTRTAINATGNVNIFAIGGTASSLSLQNPAGTFTTNFLAGAQSAALTYTLPIATPSANSILFSSGGAASDLSWTNTGSNGQVLTITGGIPSWQNATSSGWQLTGNAGTTAYNGTTGNFLGTTDAQPLVIATTNATAQDIRFFTGNTEKLRLSSTGEFGIGLTATANRLLHVTGTSGTPNIRFNSLSGANLATVLAATDGLVIADGNGDLTKRSTSILNGNFVQYDVTSTQGTSVVRTDNLFNVSYSAGANDANAAGAVINAIAGATNRSATGLTITTTATGSGTSTALAVTAGGGTVRNAINSTGNINLLTAGGAASVLNFQNPAGTFSTSMLAGAQAAALTYTLPIAAPAANSILFSSGGATSDLSWSNTGTNGQVLTITGGIPSWQNSAASGSFVNYNTASVQNTAIITSPNYLFNVAYAASATTNNALGGVITSTAGTTGNTTATGLAITATAHGTGTSTGLSVTAGGGGTNYAATFNGGNVGVGTAAPVVALDVVKDFATREYNYTSSISGTQNNVNFDGANNAESMVRIQTATAPFLLTGFVGGQNGKHLTVYNGTNQSMTIVNQSASSTAANRIITGTIANITVPSTGCANFIYSSQESRWVCYAISGASGWLYTGNSGLTDNVNNFHGTLDDVPIRFVAGATGAPSTKMLLDINGNLLFGKNSGISSFSTGAGRLAFGDSVTTTRLNSVPTYINRVFNMIDPNAVLRVWRFNSNNGGTDPAVEFIGGTNDNQGNSANSWWDVHVTGTPGVPNTGTRPTGEHMVFRRRTGASDSEYVCIFAGNNVGIGSDGTGMVPLADLRLNVMTTDDITNAIVPILALNHRVRTGTPASGTGTGLLFRAETTTTDDQLMASINALWTTATNSSRTSALTFSTVNNASSISEAMRINGLGYVGIGQNNPSQKLEVLDGNLLLSTTNATTGQIQFQGTSSGLSTFQAGAQGSTTINYTLPTTQPTTDQVLAATSITGGGPYNVALGWANAGGGGSTQWAVKGSDESVTSSTTLQNDNTLLVTMGANENWEVSGMLMMTSNSTTPNAKLAFSLPTGASMRIWVNGVQDNSTTSYENFTLNVSNTAKKMSINSTSNATLVTFKGWVTTSSTNGDIRLRWAQNTSNGTATVMKAESYIVGRKLP